MRLLPTRILPDTTRFAEGDPRAVYATMGLFFLVVCAVGILRPIKNALALDGLGATDFYQVYLVSAAVVLFVPAYNRLAERIGPRLLIPGVALFFASHLLVFRLAFREGSAVLGMVFYGWYDLLAAVLVSQFFLATQLFFTARNAKQAYPLVVAGGSVGATLGSAVTGFFAEEVGAANLLLVAAGLIAIFGVTLPLVWGGEEAGARAGGGRDRERAGGGGMGELLGNSQVRLIAIGVLLTVVVKQLVDYQFNALSLEVYRTPDAVSAFQGKFNAATQWLPFLVVLGLRPLMRRWGVGVAVLLLPGAMLIAALGLAAWWSLLAATVAKATDAGLRYSAERTSREVLYVPLPQEIKLRAKSYIDVAVEKGIGKVVSAGVIFVLLSLTGARGVAVATVALALVWLAVAVGTRREYVRSLARSLEGRFASLRGISASLSDASSREVVRRALQGGDPVRVGFVLDLLDQAGEAEAEPFAGELGRLLESPSEEIRIRALAMLARHPRALDEAQVRARLLDEAPAVRQAAVRVLCAAEPARREAVLSELLASPERRVRTAALTCLALGEISADGARLVGAPYLERWQSPGVVVDAQERVELALALGTIRREDAAARGALEALLEDADPQVVSAALRTAGLLGDPRDHPRLVRALGSPRTRGAARDALVRQGGAAVAILVDQLRDPVCDPGVRRQIPAVLARIPEPATVRAMLEAIAAPETDQLLDYRTLKALNQLRARHPELPFPPERVLSAARREAEAAAAYAADSAALAEVVAEGPSASLLRRALCEAWEERREGVFRCLGLGFPPREMYRCFRALVGSDPRARSNGLEWLEQTVGYHLFQELAPVLDPPPPSVRMPAAAVDPALRRLCVDGDSWVASCALRVAVELRRPWAAEQLAAAAASPHLSLRELAGHLQARATLSTCSGDDAMDLVEKVFLLQQVDLLRGARGTHLALLASIAAEVDVAAGTVLIRQGETPEALYVMVQGEAELGGLGGPHLTISGGMSFGTWALIDQEESLVEVRTTRPSRLLRIDREDFFDLLADHSELAVGLLQGLARRVRTLVA